MVTARIRLALCASLLALGLAVMAGWLAGIETLKSILPDLPTMKFNTALCFALVGAGLTLAPSRRRPARWFSVACGALVLGIGAATLYEYATGADLGIDELAVADTGSLVGSGYPGRMSPLTAAAWVALGTSIVLLAGADDRRWLRLAHLLSGFAGFISFLTAAGHVFGAEAFWGLRGYVFVAIHTAAGLAVCLAACLMTRPAEGWLSGFTDAPSARAALLRLLPLSLAVPAIIGALLLFGSGLGAYNAAFGFALFVPLMTVALIVLGFRVATSARKAELALRASETRAREQLEELEAIYESSPVGLAFITPDLRFVRVNRRLAEMNGVPAAEHVGRRIADVVPGLEAQVEDIRRRLAAGEAVIQHEISGETPAAPGSTGYWLEYWVPLTTGDGELRGLNVVVEEITERKTAEERQKLLIDELNHRVRNTLAVVQAMARQTFSPSADPGAARQAFEDRLQALAGAHGILTRENWGSADLREVIRTAAGAQLADRMSLDGPRLAIPPNMAVSLSLALHELATNASKYGALSQPAGRVQVRWSFAARQRTLTLHWEEQDGPPVAPPPRRGFGTRLLERALSAELGGAVRLDFRSEGLVCRMEARLP